MRTRAVCLCLGFFGCGDDPFEDLTPLSSPQIPAEGCDFSPEALPHGRPLVIDVAQSTRFRLPLLVDNDTDAALTANAADYRWTCHEAGFTSSGPLLVPDLGGDRPFCQSGPDEGNFVGFDIVDASGVAIPPGGRGVVYVDLVPDALGRSFNAMFDAAVAADECVAATGAVNPSHEACAAAFEVPGVVEALDVQRLAEFAIYDGRRYDEVIGPRDGTPLPELGASYAMTVQGILLDRSEGGAGEIGAFEVSVELCRSCGRRSEDGRHPREGWSCYHE